jgi:hypothetical protein
MARRLDEIRERAGADRHSTRDSFPRVGQKFGRIIDHEPPNSRRWTEAVREAKAIATECVRLAKLTGDEGLMAEAEHRKKIRSRSHIKELLPGSG